MGHRVVGEVAVWPGGVISPAFGVSEVNSVMVDFWGAMASCLPSAHLAREEHSWFAIASASALL